jgi:hypothetical protein
MALAWSECAAQNSVACWRWCPEILAVIGEVFFLLLAFFVGKGLAALFSYFEAR